MAGIFGVAGKDCLDDLVLGTSYLQHRAQDYCGIAVKDETKFWPISHHGSVKENFTEASLRELKSHYVYRRGLGVVSGERQPVSGSSSSGGMILVFDGNIINSEELKQQMLSQGICFLGYSQPEEVNDSGLISMTISQERDFERGVQRVFETVKGDFAVIALRDDELYAARGWGRKPLILGKKDGSSAVASESNAFVNTGFEIVRDVEPGEIVRLGNEGIQTIKKIDIGQRKLGTFEWIYTAYPSSFIDGLEVAEVRKRIGRILARKAPVDADFVSPIPNSGRWHAIGYAEASGINYAEAFIRYDYSDRSYTPGSQVVRDRVAREKLIPVESVISGNRLVIIDDSIVRGTQLLNKVDMLRSLGAKEVHVRIACPPLMCSCKYGKTTRTDEECLARRISDEIMTAQPEIITEEVRKKLKLDSLTYATIEDLEEATGYEARELCLECWQR